MHKINSVVTVGSSARSLQCFVSSSSCRFWIIPLPFVGKGKVFWLPWSVVFLFIMFFTCLRDCLTKLFVGHVLTSTHNHSWACLLNVTLGPSLVAAPDPPAVGSPPAAAFPRPHAASGRSQTPTLSVLWQVFPPQWSSPQSHQDAHWREALWLPCLPLPSCPKNYNGQTCSQAPYSTTAAAAARAATAWTAPSTAAVTGAAALVPVML